MPTHQTANASLNISVGSQTLNPGPVYSYSAIYDGVGNVTQYADSVMGTWNFTYDTLNRLQSALPTANAFGGYSGNNLCMAYDAFGNRTAQVLQSTACPAQESDVQPTASYNANNQVTWTTMNAAVNGFSYDAAGNVTNDNQNTYLYDAEGRICAVISTPIGGYTLMTGYIYDAEGHRVAKGTITSQSCDLNVNGFRLTESYVLGQGGEELTVMDGNNQWQRTNVYGAGRLLATYDQQGLHYHLTDPLGTRRVQTNSNGVAEVDFPSLPFGEELPSFTPPGAATTAVDSTTLHFTGKEHDNESGNDYFGARYYASSMGRWMSPDKPFADQHTRNPQSWNLYTYSLNNPLRYVDTDGRKVEETRTVTYYPVTGATASQALANANAHSFGSSGDHAGLTTPTMIWHTDTSYSYQTTNGNVTVTTTVTSDTITLNQNVQLPQWDGYSKATPDEQKTWDGAVSKLQGHETDHEDINRAGADALDKSLPGTTSTATGKDLDPTVKASQNNNDAAVQNKVDASNQATDQKNKQLDTCTNHGTQACGK